MKTEDTEGRQKGASENGHAVSKFSRIETL